MEVRIFALLLSFIGFLDGEKLLFTQLLWRHGQRTPGPYTNDPYNETFFGVLEGELVEEGMEQHFIRGGQLKYLYVDEYKLVRAKYSRSETYVRPADLPRCVQSALANLAAFYAGSPTYPKGLTQWPSGWTPIPVHTVPIEDDYALQAFEICKQYLKLSDKRQQRTEFLEFLSSKRHMLDTINANSGDPENYSFMSIIGMFQALSIEKEFNLPMPDWVTNEFYAELESAFQTGHDYISGAAGFGLEMDYKMVKMVAGFLFKDWMDNIDAVINGRSKLKYYAYSGNDKLMNVILFGLGVKYDLIGKGNSNYGSMIIWELWEKENRHFIKVLFSPDVDSPLETITSKLSGCDSDLCLISDFKRIIKPFIAHSKKICDV